MNPLDVLKPNYVGAVFTNTGLENIVRNRGLGVREVAPANETRHEEPNNNPAFMKNKLRVAKAREFGKTKTTVGF